MTDKPEQQLPPVAAPATLPAQLPILPLSDLVVFPHMVASLVVTSASSIHLVDDVVAGSRLLGLVLQRDARVENPHAADLHEYGCAGRVLRMLKFPDDSVRVLVQGVQRIRVVKVEREEPYIVARIAPLREEADTSIEVSALASNASKQFQKIISLSPAMPDELKVAALNTQDSGRLTDLIASNLNIALEERQRLLETYSVKSRLARLTDLLNRELEVLELGSEIQSKVASTLSKGQREYFLREQLKQIQKELGEEGEHGLEIKELREKIEKAQMPEEPGKVALRELDRLAIIPSASAEYTVARSYLDWLVTLPWSKCTQDNLDIARARRVLDEDHFDLKRVKERILEYLSVRKLKQDMKGPILCFVGPPGVGKTSLGMSIARALGRKFIRLSLGGVRDEAEIRGHRRTYIGALPGRVIQGIRKAESANPVFMLDEIDKVGADFRGDPSAALLELLDPQQNHTFSDHYLEVPFDLSKVMFITTANVLDTVIPALRDRMEVLELPGYTEEEKLHIATKYVVPRQLGEHGLKNGQIRFERRALRSLVAHYTREAGVRNLEREVASVCRKIARRIVEGDLKKFRVTQQALTDLLGPPRFIAEVAERKGEPGVVTGLAWTSTGGDILFIEATRMAGKGNLLLTGSLGDVMKESGTAALSFVRSHCKQLGIVCDEFGKSDIHIHVPSGAIPKDGPSAGVAMAVALASLMSNRVVRPDVAMTGEITLRGKVLAVGGIKEKVLAASRAGIRIMIMPERNRKDMADVPAEVRRSLKFVFVNSIHETLDVAMSVNARRVRRG
ncbi:MAG: endopeptidase La [Verrucomicrobia bacterium]|nr:endopeptidase La [Verrucomicrobiota bacterium]